MIPESIQVVYTQVINVGSTFLLSVSLVLLTLIILCRNTYRNSGGKCKENKTPPSPSICLPIIGHMHVMAKYHENPWEGFSAIARRLGDVYFVKMGIRKIVVVSSLESIREVLLSKGDVFVNRPDFQR
jgi:hypothetical protein